MIKDDPLLMKDLGISIELTEHTQIESPIYVDRCKFKFYIHPPTELENIIYFKLYKGIKPGENWIWTADNCARINMLKPEYIHCSDCSIPEFILSYNEKVELMKILNSGTWDLIKHSFNDQTQFMDNYSWIDISKLELPNYMLLPEK